VSNDPWRVIADVDAPGWDTLVYLGAGDGRDCLARRAPQSRRLVLVEGDPAAAAMLRIRTRRRPEARVMDCVLAPTTGQARWYAHSVRSFDGLVRQDGELSAQFPRLLCTGSRLVPTLSLQSALAQCLEVAAQDGAHALAVDIPLTDREWLSPNAAATLARFRAVAVRRQAQAADDEPAPIALRAALSAAGFMARMPTPCNCFALFELDPVAWQLRQEHAQTMAALAELQDSVALLRMARNEYAVDMTRAQERAVALEVEVRRLRALCATNQQQHKEVRQAVARADGALRALGAILRPGSDNAA
jgi:hypothetical protein